MKQKFSIALSLAVILSMLLTSFALASAVDVAVVDVTAPTGSVTIQAGQSGPIVINLTVTGNQDGTATFQVNRNWTLSGGTFIGSNPQTFTVPAGSYTAGSSWTASTNGTVTVVSGQGTGTFTLAVSAFGITNSNQQGAKLSDGTDSNYQVTVTAPPSPSDTTAPTINCTVPDQTIWYGTDVTVNCTASDSGSGLANPADASFSLSTSVASGNETANASTGSRTVLDNAGNSAVAGPYTFKVDKKAPSVSCNAADALWHGSDVSIACTASDGGSGLANPADASFSLVTNVSAGAEDGNASTDSRTVNDLAGNSAVAGPISGNMVDKKAPAVSCGTTDAIWHGSDVSVACTASDGGSGLANPADASFTLSTNVAGGTEDPNASTGSHPVADAVGNSTTAGPISGNMIDKKAPTLSSCDAPDGSWHNNNVTLNCSYTDGGSGAGNLTVALTTSIAAGNEDANASASAGGAQSCDAVGNCADSPSDISGNMIDRKAPTSITFVGGIADGGTYYFGFVPAASICTATDGGSGLASCNVTGYSTAVGGHTLTATATDNVGNSASASISYTVSAWTRLGFYQPVDMGVLNNVKAGSTVPLKFEVFAGPTELTNTNIISAFTQKISCAAGTGDDIEQYATGSTSLRYDTTGGQFIFNWQTPKAAGSCYRVTLTTNDGLSIFADFRLK